MIADNMISHEDDMKPFVDVLDKDTDVIFSILSIGKGLAMVTWK